MTDTPIIRARQLRKHFTIGEQTVRALERVDLDIPAGQFVAITGQSGSGKSTLLYMLSGLDKPSGGQIMVAGARLDGMSSTQLARFRRNTIGFIFQDFHLIATMNALENAGLPGIFSRMPTEERDHRATRILARLGLADRLAHRPNQLSGGQQQRVAIARALFNNPPILMGDEPTGALDSTTSDSILNLLRTLCDQNKKTIILVTHDQGIAEQADRVIRLKDGQIISDSYGNTSQ